MKSLIFAIAALSATAAVAQETATETATTAEQATPAPAKDPNERICRNIEQTSTRLGRMRECKTRAEWEAQARRNRSQAESRSN